MNNYELLCVVNPEWAEGDLTKAEGMMTAELEKVEGRVLKIEKMGSRRLAYPIKGQKDGIYLVFYFTAPPAAVSALRANLKLNPGVLRVLIIKSKQAAPLDLESSPEATEGRENEAAEGPAPVEPPGREEAADSPEPAGKLDGEENKVEVKTKETEEKEVDDGQR